MATKFQVPVPRCVLMVQDRMSLPPSPNVVITGAASGFGRALAVALARRGARLTLADINETAMAETLRMALASGAREARGVRCDVTRLEEVAALASSCTPPGAPPLDLIVNNAGVCSAGPIGELSIADWRWTLDVDLFGVIYGCHAFVPLLRRQGHGHVLNVASAAGLLSLPDMAAYNVAKAGVVALSETLAAEVVGTEIGVTVLCPGMFQTEIARNGRFSDPKIRAAAERFVARGRPVEHVVSAAIDAVERNSMYCVPMADASWSWRVKRAIPALFARWAGKAGARRRQRAGVQRAADRAPGVSR
jgi:NAD(P)-dependent dehydrogenase (short-subunit alcohol dehydrogenase family)